MRCCLDYGHCSGAHQNTVDKGVTLDVNVEEGRTVVFEPGVTKTLFDSNWAGEVKKVNLSELTETRCV